MKRCVICKATAEEKELFEGIFDDGMINICSECAEKEGIPIIRKPSPEQLNKADRRYSVRERMEKISGSRDASEISGDQMAIQGNIAKLRMPEPKQQNDSVIDNYYWKLNMSRRRKKLSLTQLSELIKIPRETLQEIEKGKIPENFEEIFMKLEAFLGIKLLKNHKTRINFVRNRDQEKEILNSVRKKIGKKVIEKEEDLLDKILSEEREEEREDKIRRIRGGEIDFSKRENLSDITLNDLIELKKEKERKKQEIQIKKQNDSLFGDDLDLDDEDI